MAHYSKSAYHRSRKERKEFDLSGWTDGVRFGQDSVSHSFRSGPFCPDKLVGEPKARAWPCRLSPRSWLWLSLRNDLHLEEEYESWVAKARTRRTALRTIRSSSSLLSYCSIGKPQDRFYGKQQSEGTLSYYFSICYSQQADWRVAVTITVY